MYSPADRPSSSRAAPAKNRIWSTIGAISSVRVRARGFPVLRHSASAISSARASTASAILSSSFCRADGVASRQTGKAAAAAAIAASTSVAPDRGEDAYTSPVTGSVTSRRRPSATSV